MKLLLQIGRGSEAALAHVYRCHAAAVFAVSRWILGDVARAEEVTEEVFVDLWERPAEFDPRRGSLRAHLVLRARRLSLDRLASHGAGPLLGPSMWQRPRPAPATALPAEEREVLELTFFAGYTCRQLAELLQVPEATVKTRIREGLDRLRA
ncbi:MAG TPA: sigma factor [Acidimicrobiales bacterium]|nr:sigma factor [Acidimicrobiales bacterium]